METESMEATVRRWVVEVLEVHQPLLALAVRQRAKLEGWLKCELAIRAEQAGIDQVLLEEGYGERRADITLRRGTTRYDVELKTPTTNWRIPGVPAKHHPVTRNIAGIIADARKLAASPGQGIVCFVLFPVPSGDHRWSAYLARIAGALNIPLSEAEHCSRVAVPLEGDRACEVVVCAFLCPAGVDVGTFVTVTQPATVKNWR